MEKCRADGFLNKAECRAMRRISQRLGIAAKSVKLMELPDLAVHAAALELALCIFSMFCQFLQIFGGSCLLFLLTLVIVEPFLNLFKRFENW